MKRTIFLLFFCFLSAIGVRAQIVTIANETFEGPLPGWTITPSATWEADTNLYAGGHTSYCGYVPIGNQGDTVILTSPLYDFGPYGYAFMSFNQICKVSGSDICQIEYRENTMSSTWQVIPRSSYKGSGIYTNAMFHEGSYVDWIPGDSLAIPTNNWWKTEHFDISNEVSFTEVQFRFKITKGSVIGTQLSYGWLIDNFKLTASVHPIAPPLVELISNYGDTVHKTGPFEIIAKVATRTYAPILSPKLYYSTTLNNITIHDSVNMTAIEGDSIWTANIPQHQFETFISFSVLGSDSVGNNNSVNGGFYLKRPEPSITGYFIVGTDTSITTNSPITTTAANSWSRMLFLSNEISQNGLGGIITKLAWQVKASGMFYNFQTCYFRMVDDIDISSRTYEDPISAGATLVWSGNINLMEGWSEIILTTPFILTKGKNLLVYWHNKHNAGVSTKFNCTSTSLYQAVYCSGSTFPSGGTGTFSYDRPNARFYMVGYYNDSNSVSLHEINNPQGTVLVNPSANIPIVVTLKNKGIVNLDSCYIDWTLNGIPQSRHIWRGNLADDFNATDTIGYFSPAANQYDTILAWVSMPNGIYDSTSYDDTILRITYGISGLDMYFLTTYEDSLYSTGPFPIQAHIASRTFSTLPSLINLHIKYTYNGINSFDTLLMDSIGNYIYEAIIPQHPFGTDVEYSILLYDSLHNSVSISDRFYIKRREAGKTGYVIVGADTISYSSPMYMSHRYAWTRQVYLSHEISPSSAGGIITKLAWDYTYGTPYTLANQSCYFRVVDDDNIPLGAYEDPVTAGATLVWSGTISLTKGWSEVNLTTPFILPPDKNLLVYWHNKSNVKVGTSYLFYSTLMNDYKAIAACGDGGFPSGSGGALKFERPNARFYIIGIRNDSNSVALHAIDNLTDTIPVYPSIKIPIIFTIQNKGIANLDSCYIDWTLNGVLQPRFTWKGSIQSDYYASDTIIYSPKPNQRDTIVMWTSLPNGVYDSTSNDDTLIRIVYGMSQLDLAFISNISDTVFNTGPYTVQARIASRSLAPLPSIINLDVKYIYNGIDSYDTLPMTSLGNNIYETNIPQHVFGTDVTYSITLNDSVGNLCHIHNHYFIKHPAGNVDSNSVALIAINNPGQGSSVGNNPVQITIKNKGFKYLDSCIINWTLNGVLQTPYTYRGHLPEDFNATLTIGNYTQRSNTYDSIKVWVSLPNGVIDPKTSDDTLNTTPYGCYGSVNGNFVIGTNPGADAANMSDAFFIASKCGVSGNITLQLQNGIYNENWDFSNLSNIMGSYTLTITSLNGNRDSVMLKPLSGVGIVLNNTNNLIIKDISIDNISSVNYGVHFKGVAKNIEFRNIHFIGNTTATTSTTAYAPIYKASGSGVVDDVRFIGNLIEGGYYGIYFYGGTSTTAYGTNIVMDSNIITNQYYYATYLYYNDFSSFSHNTILSRTTNTYSYWYGMYSYYCNFIANGNKIIQRSTAIVYPYLAYIYYAGYYNATVPSMFSNNELIGYSTSTYYGMYLYSTNKLNIYNNSIYMSGTGGVRSIYVYSSTASNYDIKNNIIIMNAGTSGTALYIGGTTTPFTSDYNCLYSNGYIGYFGATRTSLLDWQTATTRDSNSLSINPSFIDVNSSLELSDYSPFIVPRLNDVAVDINDNKRTSYTTMGAYGVALFEGNNLALKSFLSQDEANDIHCFSNYTNIQVIVKNEGTEHYQFNIHNILLSLEVSGAIHFKVDTLIKAGALLAAQNDTFEITKVLPISTSGIYYIKAYLSSSLDTVYNDDTLYTTYSIHKIQLPYDIDFSTVPVEIIQKQVVGNASWAVEPDTGSMPEITPVFGTGRLTFHSESNPGSMAQLIFNGINLLGTHLPKLEFWYAHDNSNPTKRDYLAIKISTDGMNTELLNAVYRYDQTYTSPGWAHYTIDLSAYANEPCVSLILEAFSYGGGNQNIDRIRLSSSPDISLTYLSPQLTDLVACNLNNISAKVILSNLTGQNMDFDLDTCNIHFFISGMDSLYINYPLSGLLRGLGKDTITFNQTLDLSRNGVYDIIAYIDAIDNNSMNDTLRKRLLINPDLIIQDVVGIDEENCKRSGDSVYVSFKIVNMGNLTVDEFPLSLQINGVNVLKDTVYQHMEPGDYIQYAFAESFVVPVVSDVQPYYFVKIQTELPCDAQTSNNIKDIMACVDVEEIIDLTVLSIDQPLETPCEKGLYLAQVAITLSNQGNVDIEEATVYVEVDSAGTLHASFSETTEAIYARSILEYVFTETYNIPNIEGQYQVKVFVDFTEGDTNALNDTLIIHPCAIFNDVSINETSAFNWTMGQNIPNPASAITRIPYSIPQEGVIHFTLTTITGQVLHSQDIPSSAGSHSLEFDTQHLAGGIYYYSMEYQGQRIVKKMTIQK